MLFNLPLRGIEMQDNPADLKGIALASALNAVLWAIIAGAAIALW
jgi:hypothetical protein